MDRPNCMKPIYSLGILLLSACSSVSGAEDLDGPPPQGSLLPANYQKVQPKPTQLSAYGNPKAYQVNGKTYRVMTNVKTYKKQGIASWYGTKFHNKRTSSGEPYDMFAMTAAHKTLPLPTYARVTNLENGKQIIVKINDRGPFHEDRLIDLSYAAAKRLGIAQKGTGRVEIDALYLPDASPNKKQAKDPQKYYQVGAFRDQLNAEKIVNRISPHVDSPVKLLKENNSRLTKVQIGPIASIEQEYIIRQTLNDLGFKRGVLVFK